jgi:hypothetical protein
VPGLPSAPCCTREFNVTMPLQAIVDLDLDELVSIEPPRGFGRD